MATQTLPRQPIYSDFRFLGVAAVLAALAALGFVSFVRQTMEGHVLTDATNQTPWGVYLVGFVFFVGASAGATIIGLMVHAFGREDYAPLATRAIILGLCCLGAAVTFIVVHVGSIPRSMMMPWFWRNSTSMFTYTSLTYYVFGLLLLGELYFTIRLTQGAASDNDKKLARWLAIAAVPFALVVVHAPHGALFAVVSARDFWNSPLLPPHFAVVALVTGTALMILVGSLTTGRDGNRLVGTSTLAHMALLLVFFLTVAAIMDVFDFLVFSYGGKPADAQAWEFLKGGNLLFSILHIGGYIIAFGILLFKEGRTSRSGLITASVVVIVAVAAYRYNLVTVGQEVPLFPFLEVEEYSPTWVETTLSIGIVSLVSLVYMIATRILPMEESANSSS